MNSSLENFTACRDGVIQIFISEKKARGGMIKMECMDKISNVYGNWIDVKDQKRGRGGDELIGGRVSALTRKEGRAIGVDDRDFGVTGRMKALDLL